MRKETTWECLRCGYVNDVRKVRCPNCMFINPRADIDDIQAAPTPDGEVLPSQDVWWGRPLGVFARGFVPFLLLLMFLLAAAGVGWLWENQRSSDAHSDAAIYRSACGNPSHYSLPESDICSVETRAITPTPPKAGESGLYPVQITGGNGANSVVYLRRHPDLAAGYSYTANIERWRGLVTTVVIADASYPTDSNPTIQARRYDGAVGFVRLLFIQLAVLICFVLALHVTRSKLRLPADVRYVQTTTDAGEDAVPASSEGPPAAPAMGTDLDPDSLDAIPGGRRRPSPPPPQSPGGGTQSP